MRIAVFTGALAGILVGWTVGRGEDFYSDPRAVLIERDGKVVGRLAAERVAMAYPELQARAEANVALDSQGKIWAAIGYAVGAGFQDPGGMERLFCSGDGGKTWRSQVLPMTEDCHFLGFTVLADDALLLVTALSQDDPDWRKLVRIHRSTNGGQTWERTCEIPSDPFNHVGEGFLSMTQLKDGTVLLPISRWTDGEEGRDMVHAVFASTDGGQTFPNAYPTHSDCHEAHVIRLQSGHLLGAFRYQRPPRPAETPEQIRALGGNPDWAHPTSGKKAKSAFKHVWIGRSDDNGHTWKDFDAVRDAKGHALLDFGEPHGQLLQVPDGRVVLLHDCRYPYEKAHTRARISCDEGRTWEPEIYHVSNGMGYAAGVALAEGTIVVVTGNVQLSPSFRPRGDWTVQAVRWRPP